MKRLIIFLAAVLFAAGTALAQNTDPNQYWQEHFVKKMQNVKELYFKITLWESNDKRGSLYKSLYGDRDYLSAEFNITSNSIEVYQNSRCMCIKADTMKIVEHNFQAVSFGAIHPDSLNPEFSKSYPPALQLWPYYNFSMNKYAPFYLNPTSVQDFKIDFYKMADTIIEQESVKMLYSVKHTSNIINSDDSRTPIYDTIIYFCNKKNDLVEKIIVFPGDPNGRSSYYDFDILPKSKNCNAENIFDFNNSMYENFEKYDFNLDILHPSLWMLGMTDNYQRQDSSISAEVLNFPLKDPYDKTHYLKDFSGWILIDLFSYSCPPCYAFHNKLKQEQDSLGYRILEKENINMVCLIPSPNTNLLKTYADKFNINNISFCSDIKLCKYFNAVSFPKYYLYAPDGHLVFEGFINAGNYSPLLKAKAEYEKQHNLKP